MTAVSGDLANTEKAAELTHLPPDMLFPHSNYGLWTVRPGLSPSRTSLNPIGFLCEQVSFQPKLRKARPGGGDIKYAVHCVESCNKI